MVTVLEDARDFGNFEQTDMYFTKPDHFVYTTS